MRCLVTGGAGFIGRWVVKALLDRGHSVWVLDDLSSGVENNIQELQSHPGFRQFLHGSVTQRPLLKEAFRAEIDVCLHLAARINVQHSIDDPANTFENDVIGSFEVLQCCRAHGVKLVFTSTCMVYSPAGNSGGIAESHPTKPASPYAAAKLAAEALALSFYHTYDLPVIVARPFNTYGPFQRADGEGGVVPVFLRRKLAGTDLMVYGDGTQTRDLLYVEDCAEFLVRCAEVDTVSGTIINAGTGSDVTINDLAARIIGDLGRIRHVSHIHQQSEIRKLLCDARFAERAINWRPRVPLAEGIARTERWIAGALSTGAIA
jgi:nucleoside-diphosphate-sugar epimerase